jgi:hypothetical protein
MNLSFASLTGPTVLAALLASGCAAADDPEDRASSAAEELRADHTLLIRDRFGRPAATLSARSATCPAGLAGWGDMDEAGTLRIHLDSLDSYIYPGDMGETRACDFRIELVTADASSVSVKDFSYHGYVSLGETGMKAQLAATYSVLGPPSSRFDHRLDLEGPLAGGRFDYRKPASSEAPDWSRCGAAAGIDVRYRQVLRNNRQRSGMATLHPQPLEQTLELVFRLERKTCGDERPNPGERPAATR